MGKTTIGMIQRKNEAAGQHFFDAASMRFFNSKVLPYTYEGEGGVFFITSERFGTSTPEMFTVREFHPETGRVETFGEFNVLTEGRAKQIARAASQGLHSVMACI